MTEQPRGNVVVTREPGKLKYTGSPHVLQTQEPAALQSSHVLSPRTPYIKRERERENGVAPRGQDTPW